MYLMVLLGDEAQVEGRFDLFKDILILRQDRYTVCAKHTIGFEYISKHPMELLDDVTHVESRFDPFRDGVSARAR
jgi:hypothetical protein